jgi:hypothetical protein
LTLNTWLSDDERRWTFLWLSGPAGVGKSAVAQTFAEHALKIGQLGAAFFFSRLQIRDSPNGVIVTIAFQLAKRDAGYNHLITHILSCDPSIVDKSLRNQFQELIINPFTVLAAQPTITSTTRKPLVVIIDGLDECSNEFSQRELIKLIGEYVESSKAGPTLLLWLLCSRPEWHLKRTFGQAQPRVKFNRTEMTCDAAEDIADVYCILKAGLQEIHDTFACGQLGSRWPTETRLQQLSRKIGGFLSLRMLFSGSLGMDLAVLTRSLKSASGSLEILVIQSKPEILWQFLMRYTSKSFLVYLHPSFPP